MNHNIFQGEKIRLRAKTLADIEQSQIESGEYDTQSDRLCDEIHLPQSLYARKEDIENDLKKQNTWDRCNLVIETLDGISVGGICITHADRTNGTFSYGLGISRKHWRNGYASEAIRVLLRYYFGEMRFHKCNVTVYDYNEASKVLHRSLGFVEEGRQRQSKFSDGVYHDILLFGITAEEFLQR